MDANKLANVRRDIIRRKRLEDTTLQQLQNAIREKIERQNIDNNSNDVEETEMQHETIVNEAPNTETLCRTNTNDSAPNDEINEISEKITIRLEELKHQKLSDRIQLPKIRKDRKAKDLIHEGKYCDQKAEGRDREAF